MTMTTWYVVKRVSGYEILRKKRRHVAQTRRDRRRNAGMGEISGD